ncbi:MAG: hypothetical protein QXK37_02705 [Candidatus Woesearchaeota archaeon]
MKKELTYTYNGTKEALQNLLDKYRDYLASNGITFYSAKYSEIVEGSIQFSEVSEKFTGSIDQLLYHMLQPILKDAEGKLTITDSIDKRMA